MKREHLIRALDGAELKRLSRGFGPSKGKIGVQSVVVQAASFRFDLILPTSKKDAYDFILRSEFRRGTTEKVVLVQDGKRIDDTSIVAMAREGMSPLFSPSESEQYRLTFEVPYRSIRPDRPLEVRVRSFDRQAEQWIDVAVARSPTTARARP